MGGEKGGKRREKRLLEKDQNSGAKARKEKSVLMPAPKLNFKGDKSERTANYRVVTYGSLNGPLSQHVIRSTKPNKTQNECRAG